ncbi:MAG: imidazoleglycerol-phosphate dehydratase HisB [Acidimicrobiales bacterium]|nr:MAG: imidazoleglycerol-phosphate dehydratase HisB [Acidimicrobiales bacterium]
MGRIGRVERVTGETKVLVEINLDGTGRTDIQTGVGFYDHMLSQLGKHGCFDLTVRAEGDLHIDAHHTIEDCAIALGQAFRQALGDKAGIRRFADSLVPLDEALVQVSVDLAGRTYLAHSEPSVMETATIGSQFPGTMVRHIWESFANNAQIALHVLVLSGRDAHHIAEAQFKSVARALRVATEPDPRVAGIPSTKGQL